MPSNVNYEAINAKCHSILGRRLTSEDYKKLLNMNSIAEIAQFIKLNSLDYRNFLNEVEIGSVHRDELEKKLKMVLIYYIDKIDNYFSGEYRDFFMTFYLKYEIYDLKRVARLIHIEGDVESLRDNLIFVDYYKNISAPSIVKCRTVVELIEVLKDTIYYPYLKNLVDGNTKENLFRFEMALDKAYFAILLKKITNLSKNDRKAFLNIFSPLVDMMNIQWIYRGKKFYNLYPDELFNYAIEGYGNLNYTKIKEMCYSKSLEELATLVAKTDYAFMLKGDEKQDIFMERRMNRYMYYRLKGIKSKNKRDISLVLTLIELIEFEIRDIVSITEMVRYRIGYEESKDFLIKAV